MPYCWRVKLYFACGCVQETQTAHSCDNDHTNGVGCSNVWTHNRSTRRKCTDHRDSSLEAAAAGGLAYQQEAGGGGGEDDDGEEVELSVEGPGL